MSESGDSPLRNIGPVSASWLQELGIHSRQDLRRVGPVTAYAMIRRVHPSASLNLLWSLEGALGDFDWRDLSDEVKNELRARLAALDESA